MKGRPKGEMLDHEPKVESHNFTFITLTAYTSLVKRSVWGKGLNKLIITHFYIEQIY
jgi:hypothetical protein